MSYGDKTYYYPGILRKVTVAFMSLFNDIRVAKYDSSGNILNYRDVSLVFGTKQKALTALAKTPVSDYSLYLPRMSAIMTSLSMNRDRAIGAEHQEIFKYTLTPDQAQKLYGPTPYKIGFTISILTLSVGEMNQILEQILPYFAPYRTLTLREFDFIPGFTRDIKVSLVGTTPDFMDELEEKDVRKISWDLNFEIDTFLYKPMLVSKIIKTVKAEILDINNLMNLSTYTYGVSGDNITSGSWGVTADGWVENVSG